MTGPVRDAQPPEDILPAEDAPGRPLARLGPWLFAFGLAVYAATRFAGLTEFPIFFFSDEAIQANAAESLFAHRFHDPYDGMFLPPYLLNHQRWAMSLNVYLLVLPIVLLGKSILVTRGTFVIVSLLGAAAASGALRVMESKAWWSPPLLLAAMPVDFLHSRIAFETTPACFAGFLCAYLLYRLRSPRYVFLAILFGAATFYSYTAGQGIMLVLSVLLLAVDFRYHVRAFRREPGLLAGAILLLALTAVPILREMRRHPHSTREQLVLLHSYWINPIPLTEKLGLFLANYQEAFHPAAWFRPTDRELIRHRMKGMSYVPPLFAPFLLLGIGSALARWRRSPGHRVILLSPLGVPFAAAVDHLQILRVLPMVVPIALLCALGLSEILARLRRPAAVSLLSAACALGLASSAAWITRAATTRGLTWYSDYGLYGMQYGASQVFAAIRVELDRFPSTRVHLTSSWANNPDPFLDFFLGSPQRSRVSVGDINAYRLYRVPLTDDDLFVMTEDEYRIACTDPKFAPRLPVRTIAYPDGRIGFYFVRLCYSENADAFFAAELEARRQPVEEEVVISGKTVLIRHSVLDMGGVDVLFNGQLDDTLRGLEANPLLLELQFPTPWAMSRVDLTIGKMACEIRLEVTPAKGAPVVLRKTVQHPPGDTTQRFDLPSAPIRAVKLRIEIHDLSEDDPAHIEVRELSLH